MKLRHDTHRNTRLDSKTEQRKSRAPRAFAQASLLAAGLALISGCGDTINHYHYSGPDGQQTGTHSEVCSNTIVATFSCSEGKISVSLKEGEAIQVETVTMLFTSDGTPPSGNGNEVRTLIMLDSECAVLDRFDMEEGSTIPLGTPLEAQDPATLTLVSVDPGSVEVELSLPLLAGGMLNVGDELAFELAGGPLFRLHVDDLSVYPLNEPPSALLSLFSDGSLLIQMDIQEGDTQTIQLMGHSITIRVPTVSAGYSFGTMRTEIEVFDCGTPHL